MSSSAVPFEDPSKHHLGAINAKHFIDLAMSTLMVIGPVLGYIPQYVRIVKKDSAQGFARHVCHILLVSNILRIGYRAYVSFESALVLQSVAMIGVMLALLHVICYVDGVVWTRFFGWYLMIFGLFAAGVGAFIGIDKEFIHLPAELTGHIIGAVSLGIEAILGVPQLWNNWRRSSAKGLSVLLVLVWFVGDAGKTGYFIYKQTPWQFITCGAIQLTIDFLILAQVWYYTRRDKHIRRADLEHGVGLNTKLYYANYSPSFHVKNVDMKKDSTERTLQK